MRLNYTLSNFNFWSMHVSIPFSNCIKICRKVCEPLFKMSSSPYLCICDLHVKADDKTETIACSIGVKLLTQNDIKAEPSQDHITNFGWQATVQSLHVYKNIANSIKSVLVLDLNLIPKIVYRHIFLVILLLYSPLIFF